MKAPRIAATLATGLLAALAGVAQAVPIAYDGIQYLPGPLAPNGPAFGLAAPWAADAGVDVVAAGLFSPLALPSTGGSVVGCCNLQDPLLNTIAPSPGREFWASFLLFHSGPNDESYMGLSPAGAPFGDPPSVGYGVRLGQYGIFVGAAFTPSAKPFTPNGSTDLLVMHFTAGGAAWNVELYVNPPFVLGPPDLVMSVAPVTYGTMVNMNQSQFGSDEFRLGDNVEDVKAAGVTPTARTTWGRMKNLYR